MSGVRARPALAAGGLGALLVAVAALLDAEPLYVPGIATALLALAAGLWVLAGTGGVRVERTVHPRRVQEDEPVRVEVRVRAARPLPTGVLLEDLLDAPAPLAAGRRRTDVVIVARFARRGRRVLAPPRALLRDPFGLVGRTVRGGGPEEVLVLPRVEPVRAAGADGEDGAGTTRRGRPAVAAEIELDGLRAHRPGTPASRIHWPSLARRGELQERKLLPESDTRPLVVLDPRGAATPEDLDAAVRAAASLAVHLARHGGCALLIPGERRPVVLEPTLGQWAHAHARLALVDGTLAPLLGALTGRRGDLHLVCARRHTRAPRALAQAPGGGRILVTPGPATGRRALYEVAGCTAVELTGRAVAA